MIAMPLIESGLATKVYLGTVDILLGLSAFFFVNILGQYGLPRTYDPNAFSRHGDSNLFNMGYRVLAPVVFLLLVLIVLSAAFPGESFYWTLPSIGVYWVVRMVYRMVFRGVQRGNFALYLLQAATSIGICCYMYGIAAEDPIGELLPTSSDISIEFVILALLVLFQVMAQSPYLRKRDYRGGLAENCEEFLFWFSGEFSDRLPSRFQEDVVLKIVLYTVALAENHYRPKSVRRLESILYRIGLESLGL